ncbi:MAG TPA: class I SAM-dependent methyltransferase [Vicinamibacterales bacterium]|nr:class I SAM-dependent methyltransferase [Vicinamibacterales bacterium]
MTDPHAQFTADIPYHYDRHLGPFFFEPYARDMAARVAAVRPIGVLEVACGTGILTHALRAAMGHAVQLVATDLNQPMIDHARAKPGGDAIAWHQADGTQLPFPDRSFDVVVSQFGYMFFPDKVAGFREAARVLAPGGRLMFSVWSSLDENPSGSVTHHVLAALFPADPPTFSRVPFAYHDETAIRRDLAAAGFGRVAIERRVVDSEVGSAAGVATGLVRGTPMFHVLTERGADLEAVEREIARRLAEVGGSSPLTIRLDAKIVTAEVE